MKIKETLMRTKEAAIKVTRAIVPIIVYGTYDYLTQKNQGKGTIIYHTCPERPSNNLYSRAVSAVTNSNMSSYYKSKAIEEVSKYEEDPYYEAIIAIASDKNMSSYYRYEAISNLAG